MIFKNIKEFFGASEIDAMSTKQIQRQVAINTLQAQKIELDKKETASTIALTQADITELATKKGVTDATLLELKSKLGLEATEKGVWASTKMLTEAEVDLTLAELGCNEATKQSIKTKLVENGVMKEQITLAGLLRKALNFVQAHPVVTVLTAIAAVSVAALALNDLLTTSAEEAQETFKEFQEVESEINSLNSELEETKNRIDELNTQQHLSLVEAEELEKLKETNRQLELEIRNKETIARQKKKEANKSAVDYFDGNNYVLSSGGMGNRVDLFEDQLNQIVKFEEELANYSGDVNDVVYTNKKIALDNMKNTVAEALEDFMSTDDGLVEGLDDGLLERLKELYNYFDIVMNGSAQVYTDIIEGAFEKVEFKGIKDKLIDLENAGKLSADILSSQFTKFTGVLNDAGISAEELYQYIQYLANPDALDYTAIKEQLWNSMGVNTRQPGKYAYDTISMFQNRGLLTNEALEAYIAVKTKFAGQTDTWTPEDWAAHIEEELNGIDATINVSFDDVFALEDADGELTKLGTISEEVDKLQTAWSGLREMMDNYNKTGTITVDQFQDLLSYGDEYLQYLVDEKGNLQLNEEALKKVAAAKIENMKAEILRKMISNLDLIVDQATAEDFLKDKINASTLAIADNTEALKENIETKLRDLAATKGITEGTMDAITAYVNNTISVMDKLGSSISTSSFSGAETDWKDLLDKETNLLEKQLEAGLITFDKYTDKRKAIIERYYRDGLISAEEYYSALEDMYDYQLSVYDKILNAVTRRFDKEIESIEEQIEALEKSNELLEKQKDDYDRVLSVISEVYDKEIERIQEEQDAIQDKIDLLQEENDENQRAIELEKAKYELARLQSQRTKKLYVGDKGYVYDVDHSAIRDAQDNLAGLELEQTIDALEKEKEALDTTIEELEKHKELWAEIPNAKENAENQILASSILGANYEKVILEGRIEDIESFKEQYISVQEQIDDNTSMIESYEEKITYYENLKQQWADIANTYEQAQEDMLTAQVLGADWESQVLSGRLDTLNTFKKNYISIQEAMAKAAVQSANAQIEAAKEAAKAEQGSKLPNPEILDSSTTTVADGGNYIDPTTTTMDRITSDLEEFFAEEVEKELELKIQKNRGSKVNSNMTLQKYHDGLDKGYVASKYRPLSDDDRLQMFQRFGNGKLQTNEVPAILKQGELVMTQEQQENMVKNMQMLYGKNIIQHNPPTDIRTNNNTTPVVQNINLTLPNVTNNSGYERLQKELKQMQIDALQIANKR